jgi:hypothetical protein
LQEQGISLRQFLFQEVFPPTHFNRKRLDDSYFLEALIKEAMILSDV